MMSVSTRVFAKIMLIVLIALIAVVLALRWQGVSLETIRHDCLFVLLCFVTGAFCGIIRASEE